ncbi:MAG TPA: DinB family protein [Terriglobales bacterium]|nr:DinB family protein [Terriglobales bacterium]
MRYEFLVETYETERIKVLSVWSEFHDIDMAVRPRGDDPRGRSVHEQMVHQCVSEDLWFRTMLDIDVGGSPLPTPETRLEFIRRYAEQSAKRARALREKGEAWWEEESKFFDVKRSRAWIITRRLSHTSHHRGQQMAMLRMLGRNLHSNYGPTADTGGLMQDHAPTIYAYPDVETLLREEAKDGVKATLPPPTGRPVTERPNKVTTSP